jgi:WD40 repeat protein
VALTVVKTLFGHTSLVSSVSISSDCTMIASGSHDKTIRLWDIQTGVCHCVIEQQSTVDCVGFSPTNPQCLISVSSGVVQQWDINGLPVGPTYQGSHAAFSLDGTHFVLCRENVVMVQNSDSGAIVTKCHPNNDHSYGDFSRCCFSPDGGLVAVAANATIYVWDITGSDPCLIKTFIGHNGSINSIIFSSSLISASSDRLVKFWQTGTLSTDPAMADTTSTPLTSPSIQSITLQVKENIVISSDLAGVVRVWDLSTGLCKAFFQTPAEGFTWRDAQMIDGKLIFVWHKDMENKIYVWDAEKSEPLQTVKAHSRIEGLRISGDGSKVFCLSRLVIQAWSMWTGEAMGEVGLGGEAHLDPLCVDGSRIWAQFKDLSIQGWDFGILGSSPVPLSNTSSERPYLHFIDGTWFHVPSRIEDTVTRKEVFQLSGRYADPTTTQWDGQYLVAGYESGEVVILDFNHLCVQ